MKKILGLFFVVIVVAAFNGCQQNSKKESLIPEETQSVMTAETTDPTLAATMPVDATAQGQTGVVATDLSATAIPVMDDTMVQSGDYSKPSAEQIQQALKNANLYVGAVDGKIGPKTKEAIKTFQQQNDLAADGKVGPKTWSKLSAYLNMAQPTATTPASTNTY